MKVWSPILAAIFAASSAHAAEYQFKNSEPIVVNPDEAYVLVRTFPTSEMEGLRGKVKFAPILVREVSGGELAKVRMAYDKNPLALSAEVEPNVVQINAKQPFTELKGAAYLIISVKPGTYVLGGVSATTWALKDEGIAIACLCMGTVKFEAKPGVLTDLGAILVSRDDQPTDVPEFAGVVSGKPRGFGRAPPQIAVRPTTVDMEVALSRPERQPLY